jgi:hypothetical protein
LFRQLLLLGDHPSVLLLTAYKNVLFRHPRTFFLPILKMQRRALGRRR